MILEACVGSVEGAVAAQTGGASRVELCAALADGGCTPSLGTIQVARRLLNIPMCVIIRPRGGDFCYSKVELETMLLDIDSAKNAGAYGVVLGVLKADGTVNAEAVEQLVQRARPMKVTCHRAFDVCRDPFEAMDTLVELGVDRILTSGQQAAATEGLELLAELVQRAGDRIIIMPCGELDESNLAQVAIGSGAREFHARVTTTTDSPMTHRNPNVYMGADANLPEYARTSTDPIRIAKLVAILQEASNA